MRNVGSNGRDKRGANTASRPATLFLLAAALLAAVPALAEHTRWWRQTSFEEFDKGTAKGVALRSDGKLFLAPRFAEFADANLAFLLQIRADSKGNLYAAGGSNAKVLRIDASGKTTSVFESSELTAQALALDAAGNLYVGTSPDGKVYKVTPAGQSSVFFDPKTKYIWDLAVDKDGTVYVATGDTGKIFSVAPDGKGQVFYSSEETHIRTLALDSAGNVLAGTEPSGRVLRIPKAANNRRAFVLYETSKKEITALLMASDKSLYVAAVGEKTPPAPGPLHPQPTEPSATSNFAISLGPGGTGAGIPIRTQSIPFTPLPTINSSSIYRIAPDGSPDELWSARDEVVYSMGLLPDGKLLLGTGNEGAVLELEPNHMFSKLAKAASRQITSIAAGPGGKLFLAAANPGKIFALGPDNEPEGTFESQPFDAHIFSRWGRTAWWGENISPAGNSGVPRVAIYARSGNTSDPDSNWSDWAGPYSNPSGDKLECPPARFVQWKVLLRGAGGGPPPEIDWFSIAYLPKNIPPEVTAIALQDPGVRVQGIALPAAGAGPQASVQLRMPQPPASATSPGGAFAAATTSMVVTSPGSAHFDPVPQGFFQKGYESVLWTADDANDDQLEFSIYFRGENETTWKLLKDKLDTRFYSWDTTAMPDGAYYLKIVASDAPSNPAGEELSTARESDRFVVDNTPPAITGLTADAASPAAVRVRFQASAPVSFIARAEYSLDAGDWMLVFPAGGLSDASRESYDFELPKVSPGEHTVTVRVYDQFENVSSAKATVRISASGN
jgi:outer membrane protein assembly factor BamB